MIWYVGMYGTLAVGAAVFYFRPDPRCVPQSASTRLSPLLTPHPLSKAYRVGRLSKRRNGWQLEETLRNMYRNNSRPLWRHHRRRQVARLTRNNTPAFPILGQTVVSVLLSWPRGDVDTRNICRFIRPLLWSLNDW